MQINNNPLLITYSSGSYDKKRPERLPIVIDAQPEFKLATKDIAPTGDCRNPNTDVVPTTYAAYSQQARFVRSFGSESEPSSQINRQQNLPSSVKQYMQVADLNATEDAKGIFINEKV